MRRNSAIIIWVRLELNILRFLPIITSREYSPIENSIKYFLIQRVASIFYIICILLCLIKYSFILELFIFIRIMVKLGAAPFHRWFLSLSKTLNLFTLILISTIQKIIPIVILSSLNLTNSIIIYVCVITVFVIFYSSLLLLRLIKILALSSINNLLWFFIRIISGFQFFYLFLIIYGYLFSIFLFYKNSF